MRNWLLHGFFIICVLGSARSATAQMHLLDLSNLPKDLQQRLVTQNPEIDANPVAFSDIERLLEFLILNEQYDAAEVRLVQTTDGPRFRLHLGRIQKILALNFRGNESLSDYEVRREFGLTDKAAFDPQLLIEAAERVRSYYETQGFDQTKVDLEFIRAVNEGVKVTITVNEGPRTLIGDFEVLTTNTDLAKKLKKELGRFRKEAINDKTMSEIRAALRSFLSRERFYRTEIADPQIEKFENGTKARLVYQLKNVDRYFVETEGNLKISSASLQGMMNLSEFSSSNPNVGAELGSKVKTHYVNQGYARVEVNVREEAGRQLFEKVIRIIVNEGPRIKIRRIDWTGRFSRPAEAYTQFLMAHSSKVMASGFFVKEDLDTALKNFVTDRWNQGYLRARIVSTRSSFNASRDEIAIQINFDEGALTQIRSIKFEGIAKIPEDDLRQRVLFKEGEALKLNDLELTIVALRQKYRQAGYLEMTLINERQDLVRYNADNTLVDVVFQIYEGPLVQVGSVVVEGNTLTRDSVALKELEFGIGDTLTPENIEESISRLQRLGHFSSVEIRTLEEKTPISVRTVIVRVQDRDPGLFNLGFGLNSDRGFTVRGYTGVAYRNIMGTGRGVSARIDANYNVNEIKYLERRITLGYLEPYIFDSRVRGRINLTRAISVSDFSTRIAAEVNQTTYTLEQDITSNILLSWDVWSLATVRDFDINRNQDLSLLDIATTGFTMDFDYRDHPFNPTRGLFSRLNLEYSAPWLGSTQTIEYGRGFASLAHYFPIRTFVWANSVRMGYLKNLSSRPDGAVPYDKKGLVLGGQSTIRGFTPDEAFPNRFDFGADFDATKDRYNMKTEADMYLLKSELRFPVWGQIGGAVFYDGGAVTVRGVDIETPYRHSAGFALRYSTPVGAVSFEYGVKLNPKASRGEAPGVFHFSIGTF
jgi:outer membrane protein insertion porin family